MYDNLLKKKLINNGVASPAYWSYSGYIRYIASPGIHDTDYQMYMKYKYIGPMNCHGAQSLRLRGSVRQEDQVTAMCFIACLGSR